MEIKINEQITFFRKQMNITQDDLAAQLGVTNQAVSKWENNICCPDIQLLPKIAELFNISIDTLFGKEIAVKQEDFITQLKKSFGTFSDKDKGNMAFKAAAILHMLILSDCINPSFNSEEAMKHIEKSEWGYSSYYEPSITTTMKKSSVFFSDNNVYELTNADIKRISEIIKAFSVPLNLRISDSLYKLTVYDENKYASLKEISENSGFSEDIVSECVSKERIGYLTEKEDCAGLYRFEGMYMNIIPVLSLFGI